jgi:RNA polymerase sigma-70 factor (sigma-E family)
MDYDDLAGAAALRWTATAWPDPGRADAGRADAGRADAGRADAGRADRPGTLSRADGRAETAIEALYQAHAVGLIRMAYLMLGDRPAAEDVVQDAFCNLYRAWDRLADPVSALPYVRSSVLNGCRSALRRRVVGRRVTTAMYAPPVISAEAAALGLQERQEVMQAVRQLPARQREALVLRFYLDLPEQEIAQIMGVQPSTVRSATHRALKALGQSLERTS